MRELKISLREFLKGHIAVANTKLKRNITGSMLDRRG